MSWTSRAIEACQANRIDRYAVMSAVSQLTESGTVTVDGITFRAEITGICAPIIDLPNRPAAKLSERQQAAAQAKTNVQWVQAMNSTVEM